MYTLIPCSSPPFNLNRSDKDHLREFCYKLLFQVKSTRATDGGKKIKIASTENHFWQSDLLNKEGDLLLRFLNSFTNQEFLNRSLYIAKNSENNEALEKKKKLKILQAQFNSRDMNANVASLAGKFAVLATRRNPTVCEEMIKKYPDILFIAPRFHISYIEPGGFIKPHRDAKDKLLSFMLYLPNFSQENNNTLSTIFYTPKNQINPIFASENAELNLNEANFLANHNEERPNYNDNNIVAFTRTSSSWHAFDYPKSEDLGLRISINVNFHFVGVESDFTQKIPNESHKAI